MPYCEKSNLKGKAIYRCTSQQLLLSSQLKSSISCQAWEWAILNVQPNWAFRWLYLQLPYNCNHIRDTKWELPRWVHSIHRTMRDNDKLLVPATNFCYHLLGSKCMPDHSGLCYCVNPGLGKFFYKRSGSKYFWLCWPFISVTTIQLYIVMRKKPQTNRHGYVLTNFYLWNQVDSWGLCHGLPTPGLIE